MNTYRACYLQFSTLVEPLNVVRMWVWPSLKGQLFYQIRTCQVVAAAAINDDANRSFLHNAFGVK